MTPECTTTVSESKSVRDEVGAQESEFKPEFVALTAEQAQELRKINPPVNPWRVVAGQVVVGLLVALAAWGFTGQQHMGWSAAYGAMAVVIPAALFARGLSSPLLTKSPGAAAMGFFLWEAVKIAVTVAMLFAAPRWVEGLSWLAMLIGLVVTMKVYWFVPAFGKLFQVQIKNNWTDGY